MTDQLEPLEGWLWKQGDKGLVKGWKRRFCRLEAGTKVYYSKDRNEKEIGYIDLRQVTMVTPSTTCKGSSTYGFELRTASRIWYLCADTDAERNAWVAGLQLAVNKAAEQKAVAFVGGANANLMSVFNENRSQSPAASSKTATSLGRSPPSDHGHSPAGTTSNSLNSSTDSANTSSESPELRGRSLSKSKSTSALRSRSRELQPVVRSAESPVATPTRPRFDAPKPEVSTPPADDSKPKDFAKRTQTAKEILHTERSYVECLKIMIEFYMNPLLMALKNSKIEAVNFTEADIKTLFSSQLNLILGVNMELLKSLEKRIEEWSDTQKIGDVFLTMAPFLKMYYEYSVNYDAAIEVYNKLTKDPSFQQKLLLYRQASGKNLGLEHLLIMPVQRIPRYTLLLTELLKETPSDHPDYENIKKAIKSLEDVTQHINEGMKRADASKKVAMDYDVFVQPHRYLVWDGVLEAKHNKQKVEMKFILFNDILVHIARSNAKGKALTAPEVICPLQLVWISMHDGNAEVTVPMKTYSIAQNSPEEKEFISKLGAAVEKALGCMPGSERRFRHQFTVEVSYEGEWKDGMMNGTGVLTYTNHSLYEGQFANGQKSGRGKMTWNNGTIYDGEWQNDLPHGRGLMVHKNGERYLGEFKEGLKSGLGEIVYPSGDKYRGEWMLDRPHGNGFWYSASGTYEGGFCYGLFHGGGKYTDAHGRVYEGGWVNGLQEGEGKMDYGFGTHYNGKWANGKRHGRGVLHVASHNGKVSIYTGEWVNDKKEGQGVMQYADGSVFEGSWKEDRRHGMGKLTFAPGDHAGRNYYEGEWVCDRMQGKGVLVYACGDKYEGQFANNLLHGNGVYTTSDGRRIEGKWNNGILEGKLTYTVGEKGEQKEKLTYVGTFKGNFLQPMSHTGIPFDCPLPPPLPEVVFPHPT